MLPFKISSSSSVDQRLVANKLLDLCERTGYSITQHNGQRIYRCPEDLQLPKGCEVFVGNIPKYMFEDNLVPIFASVDKIFQMRVMLDWTGHNRGFCFVTYFTKFAAQEAVRRLNGISLGFGKHIGVFKSLDNCRLFVGGLPPEKMVEDLQLELSQYVNGIVKIIMLPSLADPKLSRGYAFVEFESHRLAAMARRQLAPGSLILWGVHVLIDWADPIPEVDPNIMAKVKILYVGNLNINITREQLWDHLRRQLPWCKITRVYKAADYAFVHFETRKFAEEAIYTLQGSVLANKPMRISWARPKKFSKVERLKNIPQNFCVSVPSIMRRKVFDMNKGNGVPSIESVKHQNGARQSLDEFSRHLM